MSKLDRLELWLPAGWPQAPGEIRWRARERGEQREGLQESLAGLPPARELVVWTPAAETTLLRARLPTRSAAKIAKALPFALEEELIDPPDELHFAFARAPDGELAVAVTRRSRLDAWLVALSAAGLAPTLLAPATLSLPLAEGAWTLAFVGAEVVLRTGRCAGVGGPREATPPAWLEAIVAEASAEGRLPGRVRVLDAPQEIDLAAWQAKLGLPLVAENAPAEAAPRVAVNLLQGGYAPRGWMFRAWRDYVPAAAVLAAALATALVSNGLDWARHARQARAGQQEMRELLVRTFPEIRAIVDPAVQMRRGVEALAQRAGIPARGDLLALLARAAPALDAGSADVRGIDYADGALTFRLGAAPAAAEAAAQAVRSRGLDVRVRRADGETKLEVRDAQGLADARERSARLEQQLQALRQEAAVAQKLRAAPRVAPPADPAAAVREALAGHGLATQLKRLDVEDARYLRVQLQAVPFAELVKALAELQRRTGLHADSAAFTKAAASGTVDAQLLIHAGDA